MLKPCRPQVFAVEQPPSSSRASGPEVNRPAPRPSQSNGGDAGNHPSGQREEDAAEGQEQGGSDGELSGTKGDEGDGEGEGGGGGNGASGGGPLIELAIDRMSPSALAEVFIQVP